MPSRRLTPDRALEIRLSAMLERAWRNWNDRTVAEDLDEILHVAGDRRDLLAEAVGLHALEWSTSPYERQRELAPLLAALDLPDVDRWYALARERAKKTGSHTAESFTRRDLPGVGIVAPRELPGL